jgi:hypothetical protein
MKTLMALTTAALLAAVILAIAVVLLLPGCVIEPVPNAGHERPPYAPYYSGWRY